MSLEVGRVGVRPDQLDNYGRINPKSQFIQNLLNDLPVWTDLPVWYRGTEQLLPVNDDEPDTSPILCDIEYPVADLKNNQYFTYRQSPTQKDGKAKIRGIRGKTLVWNQQIPVRTTNDTVADVTVTSNKDGSYSISGTATSTNANYWFDTGGNAGKYKSVTGHKLFIQDVLIVQSSGLVGKQEASFGQSKIITSNFDGATRFRMPSFVNGDEYSSLKVVPMCIDLTLMFGAGNEPTTVKEFTDLFPLPYYKYNAGSLLNFAGTKVKTVGYNQVDREDVELGGINSSGVEITDSNNARSSVYIPIMPNTKYVFSTYKDFSVFRVYFYDENKTFISPRVEGTNVSNIKFTTPKNAFYLRWTVYKISITLNDVKTKRLQLEFGEAETPFVPYVENETDLPISTFFPTGMKSAGAVYDELTPTRATTKVKEVDLGSLSWTYNSTYSFFLAEISDMSDKPTTQTLCAKYTLVDSWVSDWGSLDKVYRVSSLSGDKYIRIKDTTYNDPAVFKTAMSGVMLNYELAVEDVQPTMSFGD